MATKSSQNFINDAINEVSAPQTETSPSQEDSGVQSSEDYAASASDSTDWDDDSTVEEGSGDEPIPDPVGTDPAASAAPSAQQASVKESIVITDETGRKRRVEIDYSDRASVKKAFELMHGARKWQTERDRAIASEKSMRDEFTKDRRVIDALEQAYQQNGEEGVLDLLGGKPGASKEWLEQKIARAEFLRSASPQEAAALEQRERLEKLERELARTREEGTQREKRISDDREQSQLAELQSRVNPVFEKYRFDGKLGDADDEALFDETLWNTAMGRLKPYEEKGVEITRELVDQAFRETAGRLRKRLGVMADKKATSVIEKKKQEATEAVQTATTSAYKRGGAQADAEQLIKQGNFRSLFSNWDKLGGSFKRK